MQACRRCYQWVRGCIGVRLCSPLSFVCRAHQLALYCVCPSKEARLLNERPATPAGEPGEAGTDQWEPEAGRCNRQTHRFRQVDRARPGVSFVCTAEAQFCQPNLFSLQHFVLYKTSKSLCIEQTRQKSYPQQENTHVSHRSQSSKGKGAQGAPSQQETKEKLTTTQLVTTTQS